MRVLAPSSGRLAFTGLAVLVSAAGACASQTGVDFGGTAGSGGSSGSPGAGTGGSASAGGTGTGTHATGSGGNAATTTTSGSGGVGLDGGFDGNLACVHQADCQGVVDACNTGSCINNVCVKMPANEGGMCDDGLYCTDADSCTAGVCAGIPKLCPSPDACHVGTCDEATKACDTAAGNDGATCALANNVCFVDGSCANGNCIGATPVDCSMLANACNLGVCDPLSGCVQKVTNEGGPCDDGLFCTSKDTCKMGTCGGVPMVCAPGATACSVNTCSEVAQACEATPAPDGTACSSMDICTSGQTCTAGTCGGGQAANDGVACKSADACMAGDVCAAGICAGTPISQCLGGDGCCPPGCTNANDSDCTCNVNLALAATGSISSGGQVPPYTPVELNNGIGKSMCQWSWVNNGPAVTGAYFELDWPAPVTIASFYVEAEDSVNPGCADSAGRNLASGDVQTWNGAIWVTAASFSGKNSNFQFDLPAPVTTSKLRLNNVTADSSNTAIYEWHVFGQTGCIPPPD